MQDAFEQVRRRGGVCIHDEVGTCLCLPLTNTTQEPQMLDGQLKVCGLSKRGLKCQNTSLQVQTGFGRTGEHYWGFEMHGVSPDIGTSIHVEMSP